MACSANYMFSITATAPGSRSLCKRKQRRRPRTQHLCVLQQRLGILCGTTEARGPPRPEQLVPCDEIRCGAAHARPIARRSCCVRVTDSRGCNPLAYRSTCIRLQGPGAWNIQSCCSRAGPVERKPHGYSHATVTTRATDCSMGHNAQLLWMARLCVAQPRLCVARPPLPCTAASALHSRASALHGRLCVAQPPLRCFAHCASPWCFPAPSL